MGIRRLQLIILLFSLGPSIVLKAQFSGTNVVEYQLGKLPGDTVARSTLYDRASARYSYKRLNADFTLEQFHSPIEGSSYLKLTQYSINYNSDRFEITAGNFYETIGRGLLLRSYEIPGAILEDLSYRSRNYFHRDIFGIITKFNYKNFSAKLLYGKPLNNVFPPSLADSLRRTDKTGAFYADYSFKKQTFGAAFMNLSNSSGDRVYGMLTASGTLFPFMSYYTELAKKISGDRIGDFSGYTSFAYYGSFSLIFDNIGISVEYKNYNNFLIGAGINEPPALIKEHSFRVLNRSTHVLQPSMEKGYQLEIFYTFSDLSTLTLNNTLAINSFGKVFKFKEYFIEYDFTFLEKYDVKVFLDYADDPFKAEEQRISFGSYLDWEVFSTSSLISNYEFQSFRRLGAKVRNHVISLGYSYKSKFIFNVTSELSNDPFLAEEGHKIWMGTNFKFQVNNTNSVQLFAGQRRGGPACNAGVCYEVLDFSGAEIRWTVRF